ncbi:NAD(P)-dependent dehydrogenase (short-subunit alcohol dehydrogenase family) [Thermocatellispora tengchongensis]|uniref:NAD(P)-dependent dehydrogenase (Short-subunit alcohol dehydrogenase family) n=2 Tax=Thermocatellispora tengchongensis TaxID=1073253 RepID=A0A840P2U5_9ACTN|nr:SDR family NAD(P)-dependent oxidoreductase [Thermocatellispora tengchongensis]MBB5132243.1 NAD(P)-dependent dehydrogenase (short-subunit alcohol dehydrogenase family) [Thermocatellispora tengchongensis]
MTSLDGKRMLITGAGRGMGREIAVEAARQGAEFVAVADIDAAAAEEAAAAVEAAGAKARPIETDLSDSAQVRRMVELAVAGAGGLDTLVNNAGVLDHTIQEGATYETLTEEAWDKVYAVNVKAVWLAAKYAAPHLKASDRGPSVVNASSVAGLTGYGLPAYTSSKGAVIQLTRSLAVSLAPEVRCNAYCPGSIETPMSQAHLAAAEDREATLRSMTGAHLIPRFGTTGEIAKAVCFLASDAASFITGVALPVDGGTMAWRGLR